MIQRKLLKLQLILKNIVHSKSYMKTYNKYLTACGVNVNGSVKYIHPSVSIDIGYANRIHIGDNCVISINSIILAHDFSLECGMNAIGLGDSSNEKKIVNDVYIGDNVFVGAGCIILPGTHIGNDCIVGAGTVCSGIIPDNSVIVGDKWSVISTTTEWVKKKMDLHSAVDSDSEIDKFRRNINV